MLTSIQVSTRTGAEAILTTTHTHLTVVDTALTNNHNNSKYQHPPITQRPIHSPMSTDESAPTVATAVTADESALAVPAAPGTSPDKRARKRKLDVDTSLIITEGRRRRRSPSPAHDVKPDLDPRDPERAKTLGLQLLARIMAMKDSKCVGRGVRVIDVRNFELAMRC